MNSGDEGFLINATTFERLYKSCWKKLFGICYHQIRNEDIAKEIVQDIFRSLWERRESLQIRGSAEQYLIRAAKLEIMDYFRTMASREVHLTCIFSDYCDSDTCTEQDIHARDLKKHVELLVDSLPCQCREVYRRSRELGMSNKEIASSLLISVKAVEYHMTKALSFLKRNLQEYKP